MSARSSRVARPASVRPYAPDPNQTKPANGKKARRSRRKNPGGYADGGAKPTCCMCGAKATLHNLCDACRAKVYARARAVLHSRIQNDMKTWLEVLADCESRLPLDDMTAAEYYEFSQDAFFVMYLLRKAKETYTASTGNTMALLPKNALLQIVKDLFGADWTEFERQVTERNASSSSGRARGRLSRPKRQERIQMSDLQDFLEAQVQQRLSRVQALVAGRAQQRQRQPVLSLVLVPKREGGGNGGGGGRVGGGPDGALSAQGNNMSRPRADASRAVATAPTTLPVPVPREGGAPHAMPSSLASTTMSLPALRGVAPGGAPLSNGLGFIGNGLVLPTTQVAAPPPVRSAGGAPPPMPGRFPGNHQQAFPPPLPGQPGIDWQNLPPAVPLADGLMTTTSQPDANEDLLQRTATLKSQTSDSVDMAGRRASLPKEFFKFVEDDAMDEDPLSVPPPAWDSSPSGGLFDWPSDDAETTRTASSGSDVTMPSSIPLPGMMFPDRMDLDPAPCLPHGGQSRAPPHLIPSVHGPAWNDHCRPYPDAMDLARPSLFTNAVPSDTLNTLGDTRADIAVPRFLLDGARFA